jgi:hypothetical protein
MLVPCGPIGPPAPVNSGVRPHQLSDMHIRLSDSTLKLSRNHSALGSFVLASLAIALFWWWASCEYTQTEAKQVAHDFLQRLEARQYTKAFELTVQQGYVGKSPEELQAISEREFCKVDRLASIFPFQSNGNRMRRWFSGREVDMPQVVFEFTGRCLLGVAVRKTEHNTWRVFRFASHAG